MSANNIKILHEEQSQISGKIKVRQCYDILELYVNDVKQSIWSDNPVRFAGTYWGGVAGVPLPKQLKSPQILMLGLGGATIPRLFSQEYPTCQIVAVEIDPQIISIANNYFNLSSYSNIKVIHADANRWLEDNYVNYKNRFDVICLDTYISDEFNFNTKNKEKIEQLLMYLSSSGTLITNRIFDTHYTKEITLYKKNLNLYFSTVKEIIIEGFSDCDNLVIYAQTPRF